jgi:hypothetical protein
MQSTLFLFRRTGYLTFSILALILFISGCGETKISQCNRLVKILNQVKTIAIPQDSVAQSQAADSIDRLRELAQAEIFAEPKVKSLQGQIVEHLNEGSQLLREASKASSDRDLTVISKNKLATQNYIAKEPALLSQLNSYCAE